MPDMDGLEATRQLKNLCPDCHVMALTVHEDRQYFFEMLAAGASGYLSKQAAADELVTAIRAVAQGNVYLQPALASWLLEDYRRLTLQSNIDGKIDQEKKSSEKGVLSKRELQVLNLVAQGLTSPEISRNLNLSPKTVARHRERIMKKLNLHTSTELVRYAIKAGLISL
jgi:two-component system response regulator NreC